MEIAEKINKLASSWEEFKTKNSIEEFQDRVEKLEAYFSRPMKNKKEDNEYKAHFAEYLRKGLSDKGMAGLENFKTGFPLAWEYHEKVISILADLSPLRRICDVETISGDYITYIYDKANFNANWSSSSVTSSELDGFNLMNIYTHQLYCQPKTTQGILEDATIDVEKWLTERISISFSKKENHAFVNGQDGENAPIGMLFYANDDAGERKIETIKCKAQDIISLDDLIKLYYSLPSEYATNGSFLMHRSTIQYLRSLKSDRTDQYIWQPSFSRSRPDTLLGVPVYECNDVPDFNKGLFTVIFADFKRAYKIVDRKEINIMRDPYSHKPYVAFYATKRVGGDLVDKNAIRVLSMYRKS